RRQPNGLRCSARGLLRRPRAEVCRQGRDRVRRGDASRPGRPAARAEDARIPVCRRGGDLSRNALDPRRARRPDRVRGVDQRWPAQAAAVSRVARRQAPDRRRPRAHAVSKAAVHIRGRAQGGVDRWAAGRALLREVDARMGELVDAQPGLDPDRLFDGLPSALWGALVLQVIGQQLSLAAAAAILTRLEALHGGRMPTPAELLATDAGTLRVIGMSRAKAAYLHDLAARLEDGRLDLDR